MKNNLHLVPQVVLDIAESMMNNNIRENEHQNYVIRIEAIRDFCAEALIKNNKNNSFQTKKNSSFK
jgi:hypothetical protein